MIKKYLKIFDKQILFGIFWVLYIASFFMGLLRYYFINNPGAGFLVVGKIANIFWHLSLVLSLIFITLFVFWTFRYIQDRKVGRNLVLFYFIGISALAVFFFSLYLLGLEVSHYNNYLYSNFGLTRSDTSWLENISLMTVIIFAGVVSTGKRRVEELGVGKSLAYLSVGILVWYVLQSVLGLGQSFSYLNFSFSDEFKNYNQMMEIKRDTPSNAAIVIPEQGGTWPDISNGPIARYFIFPRVVVSSTYLDSKERVQDLGELYFVTLYGGDGSRWPVVNKKKKEIMFGDKQRFLYKELQPMEDGIYKVTF